MEVFVILMWFYDGDSNLVDSFIDVKRTYNEALASLNNYNIILTEDDFFEFENEKYPKDWGLIYFQN